MKGFRALPFYPYLFALYALVDLLSHNHAELAFAQSWRVIWISLCSLGMCFLLFWALTRNYQRAAWLSFGVGLFILAGGHLERLTYSWLRPQNPQALANLTLITWLTLVLIIIGVANCWVKNWRNLTVYMNVVCFGLLLIPVLRLAYYAQADFWRVAGGEEQGGQVYTAQNPFPPINSTAPQEASQKPLADIYLIILDGYARQDVLQAMYALDNQEFITWLQSRGFTVPSGSRTNYMQTLLSLAALLNVNYLPEADIPSDDEGYFRVVGGWLQNNRILDFLKSQGYLVVELLGGYRHTALHTTDITYRAFFQWNDYERLLFTTTSLYRLNEWFSLGFVPADSAETHRRRVRFDFETLEKVPSLPGPKFVFAHIISPHPPFVFDAQGQPVKSALPVGWEDGSHFPGTWQEYQHGYREQVQFVNRQLRRVVDAILSHSTRPVVIVLLSDHGPGSHLDWESPDETCLWERGSNFMALYFPMEYSIELYSGISSMNLFRALLDALFDTHLGLLEDRTYYTPWEEHNLMIEVTDRLHPQERCFAP